MTNKIILFLLTFILKTACLDRGNGLVLDELMQEANLRPLKEKGFQYLVSDLGFIDLKTKTKQLKTLARDDQHFALRFPYKNYLLIRVLNLDSKKDLNFLLKVLNEQSSWYKQLIDGYILDFRGYDFTLLEQIPNWLSKTKNIIPLVDASFLEQLSDSLIESFSHFQAIMPLIAELDYQRAFKLAKRLAENKINFFYYLDFQASFFLEDQEVSYLTKHPFFILDKEFTQNNIQYNLYPRVEIAYLGEILEKPKITYQHKSLAFARSQFLAMQRIPYREFYGVLLNPGIFNTFHFLNTKLNDNYLALEFKNNELFLNSGSAIKAENFNGSCRIYLDDFLIAVPNNISLLKKSNNVSLLIPNQCQGNIYLGKVSKEGRACAFLDDPRFLKPLTSCGVYKENINELTYFLLNSHILSKH